MTSIDNQIAHPESCVTKGGDWPRRTRAATSKLSKTLGLWGNRIRQRRHLANLSPEHLQDIGIPENSARMETEKPFWRA